jgi:preprotein translocase subunit YajC
MNVSALLAKHVIIGAPQPGNGAATGDTQGHTTATGTPPAVPEGQPQPVGGMSPLMMLLIWGGVILAMYLLMFRPQRKREKQMKEMQAAITTGDNVVTNAGLFGRVADVGEDCFIIEFGTNRSIRIPVAKSEVVGIRTPKMTPEVKSVDP